MQSGQKLGKCHAKNIKEWNVLYFAILYILFLHKIKFYIVVC
jgi:hypothetical protein